MMMIMSVMLIVRLNLLMCPFTFAASHFPLHPCPFILAPSHLPLHIFTLTLAPSGTNPHNLRFPSLLLPQRVGAGGRSPLCTPGTDDKHAHTPRCNKCDDHYTRAHTPHRCNAHQHRQVRTNSNLQLQHPSRCNTRPPQALNIPKPSPLNPKPQTPNPKP